MSTTLKDNITAGFRAVVAIVKQVRDDIGAKIGALSSLTTTVKSSVVGAINELHTAIASQLTIDDTSTSSTSVWSSAKVDSAITDAVAVVINGAATDEDTLKELADKITALAQTDNGLVSAAAAQAFTDAQKAQARANIGAVGALEVGDFSTIDFASIVNDEWAAA